MHGGFRVSRLRGWPVIEDMIDGSEEADVLGFKG
jgi:hypothetical protein